MDNWETRSDSLAFLVRTKSRIPHKIDDLETSSFRFVIDCSNLEIGQSLEFTLWCLDKTTKRVTFEDDNSKRLYRVTCGPANLNPWAARAAKQLSNFAPVMRFNKNLD